MFMKSFLGACIAGVALSLKLANQTPSPMAELLSQTKAGDISAEVCQRSATRNKKDVPDFYQIY